MLVLLKAAVQAANQPATIPGLEAVTKGNAPKEVALGHPLRGIPQTDADHSNAPSPDDGG